MTVSFSYDNFPNVWDDILAETCWEAKLTLRRVSKTLRNVVDRQLVKHIVLDHGGHEVVNVYSPKHRIPGCDELSPKSWADKHKRWPHHPPPELMQHVQVADIRGYIIPTVDMTQLAPLFPSLDILRITTGIEYHDTYTPYIPFSAQKLVLFMNQKGLEGVFEHWWYQDDDEHHPWPLHEEDDDHVNGNGEDPDSHREQESELDNGGDDTDEDEWDPDWDEPPNDRPLVPPKAILHALPESYRKIVLNMNGLDQPIAPMYPYLLDLPAHVEELVIIVPQFKRVTDDGLIPQGRFPVGAPSLIVPMNILDLLGTLGKNSVRVTIVGLERVGDDCVRQFRDTLYSQVTTTLYYDVDYAVDDEITLSMPRQAREFALQDVQQARHVRVVIDSDDSDASGAESDHSSPRPRVKRIRLVHDPEPKEGPPLMSLKEKVDGILGRIELLTMPEYIKRVGVETAALEVEEYGRSEDYRTLARRRLGIEEEWVDEETRMGRTYDEWKTQAALDFHEQGAGAGNGLEDEPGPPEEAEHADGDLSR